MDVVCGDQRIMRSVGFRDVACLCAADKELAGLTTAFGQNVLKGTNDYELVLDAEEDLAGLPDSVLDGHARTARVASTRERNPSTGEKP